MDFQKYENCVWFLSGLSVALGANMARKASQKGARRLGESAPFLGLGGVLGGSWGSLGGPLEPLGADMHKSV